MGRCEVWPCYGKALTIMNFKIIIESVIAWVILGLVPESMARETGGISI